MGTDSGVGLHGENGKELQLMVKYGMTPMQAIQASTLNAARLLRTDKNVGTLEPGKLADVILLSGNVLDDISTIANTNNIKIVLKGGHIVKNLWHEHHS